jgi:6-phosphofructo-2-kinase
VPVRDAITDVFNHQRREWLIESVNNCSATLGVKFKYVHRQLFPFAVRCHQLSLPPHRVVFVEIICTDERVIAANVRETKLKSPDYKHMEEAVAVSVTHKLVPLNFAVTHRFC